MCIGRPSKLLLNNCSGAACLVIHLISAFDILKQDLQSVYSHLLLCFLVTMGQNRGKQAKKKHNKDGRKQYKEKQKRKDKTPVKSEETHVSSVSSASEAEEVDLAGAASGSQALFKLAMVQTQLTTSTLAGLYADLSSKTKEDELHVLP